MIEFFIEAPKDARGRAIWINSNGRENLHAKARKNKLWKQLTIEQAEKHKLPKGLKKVAITYGISNGSKLFDPPNFEPTTKYIADGLVGYGLIEDDNYKILQFTGHERYVHSKKGIHVKIEEIG